MKLTPTYFKCATKWRKMFYPIDTCILAEPCKSLCGFSPFVYGLIVQYGDSRFRTHALNKLYQSK